jgi:drug/metabolite transporter (DMT)-like permease
VQIAVFATIILAEAPNAYSAAGMVFALLGALLLSTRGKGHHAAAASRRQILLSTFYGVATGACYALAAVGYRAAGLELTNLGHSAILVACWCVLLAQGVQVGTLGLWMLARERASVLAIFTDWRLSLAAGFAGTAASVGWYIGYVLRPAADVRVLGMVEVVFSYLVSRHLLGERPRLRENIAITLVVIGAIFACL